MGTLGARWKRVKSMPATGSSAADVTGEVEQEEGVLVVRRIDVSMHLVAPEEAREKVERVHAIYAMHCPLYRTLHNAIQLTSSVELATA